MKRRNISNKKFGKLTAIGKTDNSSSGKTRWLCICDCGNKSKVETYKLTIGHTKTCGCSKLISHNKTHGLSKTPEYRVWDGIIQRTTNPSCSSFSRYGGRGIGVCDRWLKFENFIQDMGERPNSDLTIERVENNKGYSPDNCIWDNRINQARNRRSNRVIVIDGRSMVLAEWLEITGLNRSTFHRRQKRGLSERASLGLM